MQRKMFFRKGFLTIRSMEITDVNKYLTEFLRETKITVNKKEQVERMKRILLNMKNENPDYVWVITSGSNILARVLLDSIEESTTGLLRIEIPKKEFQSRAVEFIDYIIDICREEWLYDDMLIYQDFIGKKYVDEKQMDGYRIDIVGPVIRSRQAAKKMTVEA